MYYFEERGGSGYRVPLVASGNGHKERPPEKGILLGILVQALRDYFKPPAPGKLEPEEQECVAQVRDWIYGDDFLRICDNLEYDGLRLRKMLREQPDRVKAAVF